MQCYADRTWVNVTHASVLIEGRGGTLECYDAVLLLMLPHCQVLGTLDPVYYIFPAQI